MSEQQISIADIIEAAAYTAHAQRARLGGPPRRTHCKRGHDLDIHGKQKYVVNVHGVEVKAGRYCEKCKRDGQRAPGAPERPNAQKPRQPGRNPFADDYQPPDARRP